MSTSFVSATFKPPKQRHDTVSDGKGAEVVDRARRNVDEIDALILRSPERFRELLDSYYLLLGARKLWWQRCADADDPRWKQCVQQAITRVATRSQCPPAWLADILDHGGFPKARVRIVRIARELLYSPDDAV
jgi:hypothetical protein